MLGIPPSRAAFLSAFARGTYHASFTGTELQAVLAEAGINGCRVILVKDQGVYLMSEIGESKPEGRRKRVAYATGCNPEIDNFESWWHRARDEFGGDDFVEYFNVDDPVLAALRGTSGSLLFEAPPTHRCLAAEVTVPGKL